MASRTQEKGLTFDSYTHDSLKLEKGKMFSGEKAIGRNYTS